jgi:hypothetical protein
MSTRRMMEYTQLVATVNYYYSRTSHCSAVRGTLLSFIPSMVFR